MDTGATAPDPAIAGIALIKDRMPETHKAIQRKQRELGNRAFGLVRRGLRGEANCFWACERGHVVGTPFTEDSGIMAEVAKAMVTFGCTFVAIWPRG